MSVTFTFIRHAESMDNLARVWAGWKNSTLSNHGMRQASALAKSLASTPFNAIFTSDLERTRLTAGEILASQPHSPPLITSHLLREQNFGQGEGRLFIKSAPRPPHDAHDPQKDFHCRNESYPQGESLDDVERRATEAWRELLVPYLDKAAKTGGNDAHIAIVSHGIFISELVAVIEKGGQGKLRNADDFRGMRNTAWTRIVVQPTIINEQKFKYAVKVISVNCHRHLDKLVRQKAIGSTAYDPKQGDIRSFFGGGGGGKVKKELGKKVFGKDRKRPY